MSSLLNAARLVLNNAIDTGYVFVDNNGADEPDQDWPRDEDGDAWYHDFWELKEAIAKAESTRT